MGGAAICMSQLLYIETITSSIYRSTMLPSLTADWARALMLNCSSTVASEIAFSTWIFFYSASAVPFRTVTACYASPELHCSVRCCLSQRNAKRSVHSIVERLRERPQRIRGESLVVFQSKQKLRQLFAP